MVILNFYGKIPRTYISEKLKIYISNLPNESENNWNEELIEEMLEEIKERSIFKERYKEKFSPYDLEAICKNNFGIEELNKDIEERDYLKIIADNLIYIDLDYECIDMPFFDWTTNCFDWRSCEDDYAEKFINFLNYIDRNTEENAFGKYNHCPSYVYTTNHFRERNYLLAALNRKSCCDQKVYLEFLQYWGKLIDTFLIKPNDYFQLDYMINSIYKDREYNSYHLFKVYSLCEMLLNKGTNNSKTRDIDEKFTMFLPSEYSNKDKLEYAIIIRKMRNKIGHGDFLKLNDLLEKYAQKFMDGRFGYDYIEYSRQNWIYLHLCSELDNLLAKIIYMLFTNQEDYIKLKQL